MRLFRLFIAALAISVTALLVPASSPATEADGVLSMAAARKATRSVAWEVARRNGLVSSVKLGACQRRASDLIACQAFDRGSSSTLKTTCEVRVRATLVNSHPKGTLRAVNCDNERQAVLRVPQALEAARPVAEGLRAGEFVLSPEFRISRREIPVSAAWVPPKGTNEICGAQLTVKLTETEATEVQVTKFACVVVTS